MNNYKLILENNIKTFNQWYDLEIDTDALGAGGSKEYLIVKGTQTKLTSKRKTPNELIDDVRLLSTYLYSAGLQRKESKEIVTQWNLKRIKQTGDVNESID